MEYLPNPFPRYCGQTIAIPQRALLAKADELMSAASRSVDLGALTMCMSDGTATKDPFVYTGVGGIALMYWHAYTVPPGKIALDAMHQRSPKISCGRRWFLLWGSWPASVGMRDASQLQSVLRITSATQPNASLPNSNQCYASLLQLARNEMAAPDETLLEILGTCTPLPSPLTTSVVPFPLTSCGRSSRLSWRAAGNGPAVTGVLRTAMPAFCMPSPILTRC